MSLVLVNIIFATQSGNRELLLESLRDVVTFAFAYDSVHYARYEYKLQIRRTTFICVLFKVSNGFAI